MKNLYQLSCIVLIALVCITCSPELTKVVYETPSLRLIQLTDNTFIHESYLSTDDFGDVACNGLVYFDGGEAVVFDTPADMPSSVELISWITNKQKSEIKGVVGTHFHEDCVAGLEAFHDAGAMSFANVMTRDFMEDEYDVLPKYCFESELTIEVGSQSVIVKYMGEGHTADNLVGYIPNEKVLYGGCLVKSQGAGEGYTGDATLSEWSRTIGKVKAEFSSAEVVVPGHGEPGDQGLLDYTFQLFSQYAEELHGG